MQTNQWCLTLIYSHVYYDPIPVMKPQTTSRRINDPGIIAACHCGAEYKTEYSASIETHTATLIDSAQQKLTDRTEEESVDSNQGEGEWDRRRASDRPTDFIPVERGWRFERSRHTCIGD